MKLFQIPAIGIVLLSLIAPISTWASKCEVAAMSETERTAEVDAQDLMDKSGLVDFFRIPLRETVTGVEKDIEDLIVRLDHAASIGDTNEARHAQVTFNFTGNVPFVMSVENVWYLVEFLGYIRMRVSEKRVTYLEGLKQKYPKLAGKIDQRIAFENAEFERRAKLYGRYFKYYYRSRYHMEGIANNPTCNAICTRTTKWFFEEAGARDARARTMAPILDAGFKSWVMGIGVAEADAPVDFISNMVGAANAVGGIAPTSTATPNADGTLSIPQEMKLQEFYLTSLEPEVQKAMNAKSIGRQILNGVEWLFRKPVVARSFFFVLEQAGPFGRALKNTKMMDWLFARMHDADLNDDYSYHLTRLNRNSTLPIGDKLKEIRQLMAKGSQEEQKDKDVLELLARRTDLTPFWLSIYNEVYKEENAREYGDLRPKMKELEDLRLAGKLAPLSPVYRICPMENFIRFSLYVGVAYGATQHPGVFTALMSALGR